MPGRVRIASTRLSPPKITLLIGPLCLICTFTVAVTAAMQDTAAYTSSSPRFSCTMDVLLGV